MRRDGGGRARRSRIIVAAGAVAIAAVTGPVMETRPAAAASPAVLLVGDSVMAVFKETYGKPGLGLIQAAYDVTLNTGSCRRLTTPGCQAGNGFISALEVLQALRGQLPPTVVMTVGHNEKDNFDAKIDTVMQEATANGASTVLWLTYQNVIRPTAYPGNNASVHAAAARWPQMRIADWDTYSEGKFSWFSSSDGLHLTATGATEYGRFIRASLDALALPPPANPRCGPPGVGTPTPPATALPPGAPSAGARLMTVPPARLADTRTGVGGTQGRVAAGHTLDVDVAGSGGVPGSATGAVLNVTIVDPCAAGFVTVHPAGAGPPVASTANFAPGEVVAALVTVPLGAGGAVAVSTSAQADVLVDVVGYLHPTNGRRYQAISPVRIADTRPAAVGAGQELAIQVRGAGGGVVPAVAKAAALNLTVTQPASAGFLTLYPGPCNPAQRPATSSLNYAAGQTVANLAVSALGADGSVCVYSSAEAKVVVDAGGWFGDTGDSLFAVTPQRLTDTRASSPSKLGPLGGRLAAGVPRAVTVGAGGVPPTATAVLVGLTAVQPGAAGFLTAYPCGQAPPGTSNLNVAAGAVRANLAAVAVGSGGQVCIVASQPTDVIVDLTGWFD